MIHCTGRGTTLALSLNSSCKYVMMGGCTCTFLAANFIPCQRLLAKITPIDPNIENGSNQHDPLQQRTKMQKDKLKIKKTGLAGI